MIAVLINPCSPFVLSSFLRPLFAFCLFLTVPFSTYSQTPAATDTSVAKVVDAIDIFQRILGMDEKPEGTEAASSLSILPVIGYNPSLGGVIGTNAVIGRQFGSPENTGYSVYTLGLTYSTKGILTLQARHNVFRPQNKWNLQGNWQLSLFGLTDYSLGTGKSEYCDDGINISGYAVTESDSTFPIKYKYLRLYEKAYRRIGQHTYAGLGFSFDVYNEIDDLRLADSYSTPHYRYSQKHDFSARNYSANGLIVAFQFNNREHPIRSYGGNYMDIGFRFNQKWLGSSKNAIQLFYDFRKYISLSERNPEHVIAFWHWASYLISGELPYLELPYTGSDTYNRSGRAYTIGRFRGPSYAYFESEYRFPITRNKLLGGVVFTNIHTAGDDSGEKVFQRWNYAAGAGLRVLFQKRSRSALCIDFSYGNCGSSGVFFGLNEAF